jgi:hypothetical protein
MKFYFENSLRDDFGYKNLNKFWDFHENVTEYVINISPIYALFIMSDKS